MSKRNDRLSSPTAQWVIHHAARHAPPSLSARLEEEWLADLEACSTLVSRLGFALGCCWATWTIVRDHPHRAAPIPVSLVATREAATFVDRESGYVSLRSGTLFLIVGLHVALFYGLIAPLSSAQESATLPYHLRHTQKLGTPSTYVLDSSAVR